MFITNKYIKCRQLRSVIFCGVATRHFTVKIALLRSSTYVGRYFEIHVQLCVSRNSFTQIETYFRMVLGGGMRRGMEIQGVRISS